MRLAYLSKKDLDRTYEYDVRHLRKVLADIDENIVLPRSLHADILCSKLTLAEEEARQQQGITRSAASFLRSRVFSLQSVVSYALAFVVIAVVAYNIRVTSSPDMISGNIVVNTAAVDQPVQEEASAQTFSAVPDTATEPPPQAAAGAAVPPLVETESATVSDDDAPSAPLANNDAPLRQGQASSAPAEPVGGMGGGAAAIHLDADSTFTYLYRENDRNDPDKADFPLTLEVVDTESGQVFAQIDLPNITEIKEFFTAPGIVGVVGIDSEAIFAQAYTLAEEAGADSTILFSLSQPGVYGGARLHESIVHMVSFVDSTDSSIPAEILPDSTSPITCIITAVSLEDGAWNQAAYTGVDEAKELTIHNTSVYLPYTVTVEEEAEVYMAQIKFEGTELVMSMVP